MPRVVDNTDDYNGIIQLENNFLMDRRNWYDSLESKYPLTSNKNDQCNHPIAFSKYDWNNNKCYLESGKNHQLLTHYSKSNVDKTPTEWIPYNILIKQIQQFRLMVEWYELMYIRFILKILAILQFALLNYHKDGVMVKFGLPTHVARILYVTHYG